MAILLSPGVATRETDFSAYIPQISTTVLGMVGTATKGPLNKPTLITNVNQFIDVFGKPSIDSYGQIAALQFLERGNQLWYVRVAGQSVATASVTVKDASNADVLQFDASSPGTWANNVLKVIITNFDSTAKTFDLTVEFEGAQVEVFFGLSLDPDSPNYVEEVLATKSRFVVADDLTNGTATGIQPGTYTLTGGADGIIDCTADDVIGTGTNGLQAFANPDGVMINLLVVPGWTDPAVINAALSICENRGDALFIADTPMGLTPQQVVDWHNGAGTYQGKHQAFNSSYGAMYWPWLKVYDPFNKKERWVPPSGLVSAVYAYNDQVAEPWFAPAGLRRGRMLTPLAVEYNASRGERDLLYSNRNAINPIVNFAQDGITIWGQRTLQRNPSATDRVNVRRLVLMARRAIALSTLYLTFEQNDEYTWNEWVDMVTPFFESIKARRGLYDYMVQMDSTTVTPADIDAGRMPGRVYLKPTKTAEFITIDFVLMSTGAEFTSA